MCLYFESLLMSTYNKEKLLYYIIVLYYCIFCNHPRIKDSSIYEYTSKSTN